MTPSVVGEYCVPGKNSWKVVCAELQFWVPEVLPSVVEAAAGEAARRRATAAEASAANDERAWFLVFSIMPATVVSGWPGFHRVRRQLQPFGCRLAASHRGRRFFLAGRKERQRVASRRRSACCWRVVARWM